MKGRRAADAATILLYGSSGRAIEFVASLAEMNSEAGVRLGLLSRRSSVLWTKLRGLVDSSAAVTVGGIRSLERIGDGVVTADPVLILAKVAEMMSETGPGSLLLMDDLTDLILLLGFEETYRLVRRIVSTASERKVKVVALLNRASNPPEQVAAMASLFPNVFSLDGGESKFAPEFNIKAIGRNRKAGER